jgi:hypothetical protein
MYRTIVVLNWVRHAALVALISAFVSVFQPAGLQAATVTLAWDPPGPPVDVASYNIYYGITTGVYTNVLLAGNSTNATVSGLVGSTTYYFAATTVDTLGLESDFSNEATFSAPTVNQPPTLAALGNVTIAENAGPQTVNLSGISTGATNEVQTLTVTASSSNPGLIPTPTVAYTSPNPTGSIAFTPVANGFGSATITVTVNDGGASNNIFSRTFTVTVNSVNQPPTLASLGNVTVAENAGPQTVNLSGISTGATNEVQTLTVTASSSNLGLIPTPTVSYTSPNPTGSIAFTPVANAFGSATITVTLNDGGASNNIFSRTFTVTVTPVNTPPTLAALGNVTVAENAGPQTVNLSGISTGATNEVQTLTVTASSSNPGLIPTPTVTYTSPNPTGSIAFTPVANGFGSATITVTLNDGGASNNIFSRTFTVTVTPVNTPPTLAALGNVTVAENAGPQTVNLSGISTGATNEVQTLTVTASSSNPGLIPTPTVSYTSPNPTGSIAFTPVANAFGSATITVTVNDGGATNNLVSRSFTVVVDQPPTISPITAQVVAAGTATPLIPFTISDPDSAVSTLTLSAASSNLALVQNAGIVFGGTNTNRTVTVTPVSGQVGVATITITVSDGIASTNTAFRLTVEQKPAPPANVRVVAQSY